MYEVAVVGAAGFLGSAVMTAFADAGIAAVGYTLDEPLFERGFGSPAADVPDVDSLSPAARGVRTVVWCASRINPRLAHEKPELIDEDRDDLAGALAAFASLDAPPRIVMMSSGGTVYGAPSLPPFSEDDEPHPVNAYGAAKLATEDQMRASGLESVALRMANAYGPGQRPAPGQGVLAHWMEAILAGGEVHLYGDPAATRDYVYVDDIARAVVAAHLADAPPTVVNVGTGIPTTLDELLQSLEFAVAPARFDTVRNPARSTDADHSVLDVTRAKDALGWTPQVSLDEGVARMWAWRNSR